MNKIEYPDIIVVEGAMDKALLLSFLDADIITTNGSDVPCETIEYLKLVSSKRGIVVLTDPDFPGKRIRDVLDREIPGLKHAFIPKEKAIKGKKVGVAESDKETILEALSHAQTFAKKEGAGTLTYADLLRLGLVGKEGAEAKRKKVSEKFHLGFANGKTFLNRANALGLSYEDLQEACR